MKRKRMGRPTIGEKPMKRVNVVLSDENLERARQLGEGYVSKGLRSALERAEQGATKTVRKGAWKMKTQQELSASARKAIKTIHFREGARKAVEKQRQNVLYKALKAIIEAPRNQDGEIVLSTKPDADALYQKARAAIAKVTKK